MLLAEINMQDTSVTSVISANYSSPKMENVSALVDIILLFLHKNANNARMIVLLVTETSAWLAIARNSKLKEGWMDMEDAFALRTGFMMI